MKRHTSQMRGMRAIHLFGAGLMGIASHTGLARAESVAYQYCEAEKPASLAPHRMETNYRYRGASTIRSPQSSEARCEPAWVQTEAIFDAAGVCDWYVADCSKDEGGSCTDTPDSWIMYDFFGARTRTSQFSVSFPWHANPDIKQDSGFEVLEQWTRHKHWGHRDPAEYAYIGIHEERFSPAHNEYPKCYGAAYLIGFFNGVWNTQKDAERGLDALKSSDFIGSSHRGAPVRYRLFYNQTGCANGATACLEDLAEVFTQRSSELDGLLARRWEYFWEQVTATSDSDHSFTTLLLTRVLQGASALLQWRDALAGALLAKMSSLAAQLLASPPTAADATAHVAGLLAEGQRGYRAVLVGHSQGNLFASAAREGYLARSRQEGAAAGEDTGYVAAEVIHVAPASAVLHGPHVLAEIDLVINGLRLTQGTPVAANTLSLDEMPPSFSEKTGHRFVETYLDPQRRARSEIQRHILTAMDGL